MQSNQTINRSHSRKHYHEQSMDDFMKNIKKFNLRSQRYISPKSLLYMYAKNNTTNTIEKSKQKDKEKQREKSKSRTLSNHKSNHSKSKLSKKQKQHHRQKSREKDKERSTNKSSHKSIKSHLQKIFHTNRDYQTLRTQMHDNQFQQYQNPATFIEKCGDKLKKAEKYLQSKNNIGSYLCQQFLNILNTIVEKMIKQLDQQLKEIQYKTSKKVQRKFAAKIDKLQNLNAKMNKIILDMSQKAQNNSRLIYQIRLLSQIDIDYLFGKGVLGTDKCGGIGYQNADSSYDQSHETESNKQQIQFNRQRQAQRLQGIIPSLQTKQTQQKNNNNEFKLDLRKDMQRQRQDQQRQSGRIRQAYDWERQAYNSKEKQKKQKQRYLQESQIQKQRQKQIDRRKQLQKNIAQQFLTQLQNHETEKNERNRTNRVEQQDIQIKYEYQSRQAKIKMFEKYPEQYQQYEQDAEDDEGGQEQDESVRHFIRQKYKRKST